MTMQRSDILSLAAAHIADKGLLKDGRYWADPYHPEQGSACMVGAIVIGSAMHLSLGQAVRVAFDLIAPLLSPEYAFRPTEWNDGPATQDKVIAVLRRAAERARVLEDAHVG